MKLIKAEDRTKVYEAETIMEYMEWVKKIPSIKFPVDWEIQIIPPFGCTMVRFRVTKDEAWVSVYLDCYDLLGCVGTPYWEIYPYDGDTFRCRMEETELLLDKIQESINNQLIKK